MTLATAAAPTAPEWTTDRLLAFAGITRDELAQAATPEQAREIDTLLRNPDRLARELRRITWRDRRGQTADPGKPEMVAWFIGHLDGLVRGRKARETSEAAKAERMRCRVLGRVDPTTRARALPGVPGVQQVSDAGEAAVLAAMVASADPDDTAKARDWLQAQGLTVTDTRDDTTKAPRRGIRRKQTG